MKYEFKKIDLDSYELVYTNKEKKEITKEFKRTIEMAEELQEIIVDARIKLAKYLSKKGIKKDDLVIKTNLGNGKTVYDESNYKNLEDSMIQEQSLLTTNNLIEKCFGMNVQELLEDMGVDTNETNLSQEVSNQVTLFTQKFLTIIKGDEKTPSSENKQQ